MEEPPSEPLISNYPRGFVTVDQAELRDIAAGQRRVLRCVPVQIGMAFLCLFAAMPMTALVALALIIGGLTYSILSVKRLAKALGRSQTLNILFTFVPCLSFLMLVFLSTEATKRLQAAGIKVGLLGVDPKAI